jgi:hypothetical protein
MGYNLPGGWGGDYATPNKRAFSYGAKLITKNSLKQYRN